MTARMRRLASDYEEIKKNFAGHKNIIVTPTGDEPPEKYHVTYFVNGIYLLPDGRIETLGRHEVEITLHADYPRYKPICKILTPIWHPNFRDGQICIGDIWGAGESLTDIIINIGDMIQYKSWNSYSPLSADAAKWAMENKHLFPVGNINLHIADYASSKETVDIDLFDENGAVVEDENGASNADSTTVPNEPEASSAVAIATKSDENDFEITAEELEGIEFVPTAQRMQTVSHGGAVKGNKLNFKTVLVKGLLWALIGAFIGFGVSEFTDNNITSDVAAARISGHSELVEYYEYTEKANDASEKAFAEFKAYCKKEGKDSESTTVFGNWYSSAASSEAKQYWDDYSNYDDTVVSGTRYPCDLHRYGLKNSGEKRFALLKMISQYKYVTHKDLKIEHKQFQDMLRELLSAGLIQHNNLCNSYGANAYDCSPRGDELLKLSEQKAKSEIVNLIASAAGTYTGAVISQIFDAA